MTTFSHPVAMRLPKQSVVRIVNALNALGYTNGNPEGTVLPHNIIYTTRDGKYYIVDINKEDEARKDVVRFINIYYYDRFMEYARVKEGDVAVFEAGINRNNHKPVKEKPVEKPQKKVDTTQYLTRKDAGFLINTLTTESRKETIRKAFIATDMFSNFVPISESDCYALFAGASRRETSHLLKFLKRKDMNIMLKQRDRTLPIISQRLFGDSRILTINQGIKGMEESLIGRSIIIPEDVEVRIDNLRDGKSLLSFHKR